MSAFTSARALAGAWLALGAFLPALASAADVCRPAYVVPYADQCNFEYSKIASDQSVGTVDGAFAACDRAQREAVNCVNARDPKTKRDATNALYRDVTEEAEIAQFAQKYGYAQALLRERRDVLRVLRASNQIASDAYEKESKRIDLAERDAALGACTLRASGTGTTSLALARAHKYRDLSRRLAVQADALRGCDAFAATPDRVSYLGYERSVAWEESGRAAQAAGDEALATQRFRSCIGSALQAKSGAGAPLRGVLGKMIVLCQARLDGRYRFDQPRPLDVAPTTPPARR